MQETHQTGVGVLLGNAGFGIGASFRKFFGGPIGVQATYAHYNFVGFSVNEFQALGLFRFADIPAGSSVILTPYVGGGVSVADSTCCDFIDDDLEEELEDIFGDDLEGDIDAGSEVGGVFVGGVEVFFAQVPSLGVSGQVTFTSNDIGSFGGGGFLALLHWYFN